MSIWYRLDGHTPVPIRDNDYESINEMLMSDRKVRLTDLEGFSVSTVFLGINHGISVPVLFETMVFSEDSGWKPVHRMTRRYSTWEGAEDGHSKMVRLVQRWVRVSKHKAAKAILGGLQPRKPSDGTEVAEDVFTGAIDG